MQRKSSNAISGVHFPENKLNRSSTGTMSADAGRSGNGSIVGPTSDTTIEICPRRSACTYAAISVAHDKCRYMLRRRIRDRSCRASRETKSPPLHHSRDTLPYSLQTLSFKSLSRPKIRGQLTPKLGRCGLEKTKHEQWPTAT